MDGTRIGDRFSFVEAYWPGKHLVQEQFHLSMDENAHITAAWGSGHCPGHLVHKSSHNGSSIRRRRRDSALDSAVCGPDVQPGIDVPR